MPLKDLFTRKKNPSSPAGTSSGSGGSKAAGNPVESMFETYKESDDDKIGPEVRPRAVKLQFRVWASVHVGAVRA